jgi:hypothetical protein
MPRLNDHPGSGDQEEELVIFAFYQIHGKDIGE